MNKYIIIGLLTTAANAATSSLKNTNWPKYELYASWSATNVANTLHADPYACIRNNWIYNFP